MISDHVVAHALFMKKATLIQHLINLTERMSSEEFMEFRSRIRVLIDEHMLELEDELIDYDEE